MCSSSSTTALYCLTHTRETRIGLEVLTTTDVADELSRYVERRLTQLSAYDLHHNSLLPFFSLPYNDVLALRDAVFVINAHTCG